MSSSNESATSQHRRPLRPRTNNSYSNLLRLAEQQHEPRLRPSSSSIYESGDQSTSVVTTASERRRRRNTRSRFRSYLPGASNEKSPTWSSDDEEEEQKGFANIARGMRYRLSKVGVRSSVSQSPSAGASATQLSSFSGSYLELTLEESTRVAEEIKEKAHMDSIAACNHISSPIDEDLHVDAVQSPIRRKSLYTPGIATRTPDDILRKPPPATEVLQSQSERAYYFNPNKPESSPLARLAALEIPEGGRSTPSNLEYSHLGGLKLGTLRVTNGAATPVPRETSPTRLHKYPVSVENEAFFTASEGNESQEETYFNSHGSPCDAEPYSRLNSPQVQLGEQSTNPSHDRGRSRKLQKSPRRNGSPLKFEQIAEDQDASSSSAREAHSKWQKRKDSLPPGFAFESTDQALAIAYDYMKDLPESPFPCTEISSIVSSWTGGMSISEGDKDSFEDEGVVIPKLKYPEMLTDGENQGVCEGTRQDAFRRLNSNSKSPKESIYPTELPSTVLASLDRKNTRLESDTTKIMNKSDSGYSSSESLKSLGLIESDNFSSKDPSSGSIQTIGGKALVYPSSFQRTVKSNLRPPTLIIPKTPLVDPVQVMVASPINGSVTVSQSGASPSPRSRSRIRKLRKSRRSSQSQPPPVNSIFVQGIRNLSQIDIPPVPPDVAIRHDERLRQFPLLQHTYPSLHHVNSNDSMSSEAFIPTPVQFPSPANSMKRANSICKSDLDWPSRKRSPRSEKRKSRSRSASKNRGKSDQRLSQDEAMAIIAGFGTVAECLGDSPYDVARFSAFDPHNAHTASLPHAYELGSSASRPKSMIGIQESFRVDGSSSRNRSQSCTRFSTQYEMGADNRDDSPVRSIQPQILINCPPRDVSIPSLDQAESKKQRLSQPFDNPHGSSGNPGRPSHTLSRPPSMFDQSSPVPALPNPDVGPSQRAQNFSKPFAPRRKSFDDRGGVPGRLLRPQTDSTDVPPMPLLPTKEELVQREAKAVRDRFTKQRTLPPPTQVKNATTMLRENNPRDHETWVQAEMGSNPQENWETLRKVWSQRRKSAGDILLLRNQTERHSEASTSTNLLKDTLEVNNSSCETNASASQGPVNLRPAKRPGPRPSSQSRTQAQPEPAAESKPSLPNFFQIARKPLATQTSMAAHDRYSGGLLYGFEPGFGLGGSAGTRSMKTGASRKSVQFSRGFGLDLSDVPIFVAPSLSRGEMD